MSYPHTAITINNRRVTITDIRSAVEKPQDEFEEHTFEFIRQWFSDQRHFEIQTSGSTGIPKRITFHRDQMISSARMTEKALLLKSGYTALVCLDTRYIAGKMMLVRCFTTGMAILAVTPTANPLSHLNSPVHFTALVPYQVYHILESTATSHFNSIHTAIIGGAPLEKSIIPKLNTLGTNFFATYGMTETISHIALQKLNGADQSEWFKAIPGVSIGQDDRSCLVISVPFLPEPLVTNDIVELRNSTEFRWLGRWDNVLNSGGVKVIPEKVEENIRRIFERLELPRRFFLSSIPDMKLGDKIVLFVEGNDISLHLQQRLSEELLDELEPYEAPKEVIVLTTFEMTNTGKLNRFSTARNSDKSRQKFTLKK